MQKIRTFFRALVNSLQFPITPQYARDILKASIGFAWSLLIVFTLITTLLTAVRFTMVIAAFDLPMMLRDIASIYPSDLIITGDQNGITVNQELPYVIEVPERLLTEYKLDDYSEELPENVVVFTTEDQLAQAGGLRATDSWAIVTEDYLYVSEDGTGEYSVNDASSFETPFQLTRADVDSGINEVLAQPFIANKVYVPIFFVSVLMLGAIASVFARVAMAVVASLGAMLFTGIFMKESALKFNQFFHLSLHAIIPVATVILVLDLFLIRGQVPGWLFTLAVIVIICRGAQVIGATSKKTTKK